MSACVPDRAASRACFKKDRAVGCETLSEPTAGGITF
jgi:hypothetical protein